MFYLLSNCFFDTAIATHLRKTLNSFPLYSSPQIDNYNLTRRPVQWIASKTSMGQNMHSQKLKLYIKMSVSSSGLIKLSNVMLKGFLQMNLLTTLKSPQNAHLALTFSRNKIC